MFVEDDEHPYSCVVEGQFFIKDQTSRRKEGGPRFFIAVADNYSEGLARQRAIEILNNFTQVKNESPIGATWQWSYELLEELSHVRRPKAERIAE